MQQKDLQQASTSSPTSGYRASKAALSPNVIPAKDAGTLLPAAAHFKWEARRKHMCPSVQLLCCEGHPRTLSQASRCFMEPQISKSA